MWVIMGSNFNGVLVSETKIVGISKSLFAVGLIVAILVSTVLSVGIAT